MPSAKPASDSRRHRVLNRIYSGVTFPMRWRQQRSVCRSLPVSATDSTLARMLYKPATLCMSTAVHSGRACRWLVYSLPLSSTLRCRGNKLVLALLDCVIPLNSVTPDVKQFLVAVQVLSDASSSFWVLFNDNYPLLSASYDLISPAVQDIFGVSAAQLYSTFKVTLSSSAAYREITLVVYNFVTCSRPSSTKCSSENESFRWDVLYKIHQILRDIIRFATPLIQWIKLHSKPIAVVIFIRLKTLLESDNFKHLLKKLCRELSALIKFTFSEHLCFNPKLLKLCSFIFSLARELAYKAYPKFCNILRDINSYSSQHSIDLKCYVIWTYIRDCILHLWCIASTDVFPTAHLFFTKKFYPLWCKTRPALRKIFKICWPHICRQISLVTSYLYETWPDLCISFVNLWTRVYEAYPRFRAGIKRAFRFLCFFLSVLQSLREYLPGADEFCRVLLGVFQVTFPIARAALTEWVSCLWTCVKHIAPPLCTATCHVTPTLLAAFLVISPSIFLAFREVTTTLWNALVHDVTPILCVAIQEAYNVLYSAFVTVSPVAWAASKIVMPVLYAAFVEVTWTVLLAAFEVGPVAFAASSAVYLAAWYSFLEICRALSAASLEVSGVFCSAAFEVNIGFLAAQREVCKTSWLVSREVISSFRVMFGEAIVVARLLSSINFAPVFEAYCMTSLVVCLSCCELIPVLASLTPILRLPVKVSEKSRLGDMMSVLNRQAYTLPSRLVYVLTCAHKSIIVPKLTFSIFCTILLSLDHTAQYVETFVDSSALSLACCVRIRNFTCVSCIPKQPGEDFVELLKQYLCNVCCHMLKCASLFWLFFRSACLKLWLEVQRRAPKLWEFIVKVSPEVWSAVCLVTPVLWKWTCKCTREAFVVICVIVSLIWKSLCIVSPHAWRMIYILSPELWRYSCMLVEITWCLLCRLCVRIWVHSCRRCPCFWEATCTAISKSWISFCDHCVLLWKIACSCSASTWRTWCLVTSATWRTSCIAASLSWASSRASTSLTWRLIRILSPTALKICTTVGIQALVIVKITRRVVVPENNSRFSFAILSETKVESVREFLNVHKSTMMAAITISAHVPSPSLPSRNWLKLNFPGKVILSVVKCVKRGYKRSLVLKESYLPAIAHDAYEYVKGQTIGSLCERKLLPYITFHSA